MSAHAQTWPAKAFRRHGLDPAPNTPEEFGAFIRAEVAQNIKVAKGAGIKVG